MAGKEAKAPEVCQRYKYTCSLGICSCFCLLLCHVASEFWMRIVDVVGKDMLCAVTLKHFIALMPQFSFIIF